MFVGKFLWHRNTEASAAVGSVSQNRPLIVPFSCSFIVVWTHEVTTSIVRHAEPDRTKGVWNKQQEKHRKL